VGSRAVHGAEDVTSAGVTDYLQKEGGIDQFTILANRIRNAVEKQQTREKLARQNDRLDTVVRNAPLILFALDSDGVFTFSEGQGLAEIDFKPGEVVGDSVFDVFAGDDDILAAAEQALDGEQMTATHEVADSLFETTYNPVFDEDGNVRSVIGVATDITERVEREQELERERERCARLVESLPNPVLHARAEDGEPVIQNVNSAFERVFGYDAETLGGERLHDYILSDDQTEEVEQLNQRILDEGEVQTEVRRETTDGVRTFRLDINIQYEEHKQPDGYAIYTDVTDREERERELEILRTAIDHAHIPLVLSDPSRDDNPLVYVNDAFEEVTGYSRAEAIGNNCRFLQGEQTDPENVATLRNAVENEEPTTVDLRNYRKDGEMFWNRVSIQPIYDDDGELLRYFGSQQDITEQKESRQRIE